MPSFDARDALRFLTAPGCYGYVMPPARKVLRCREATDRYGGFYTLRTDTMGDWSSLVRQGYVANEGGVLTITVEGRRRLAGLDAAASPGPRSSGVEVASGGAPRLF